MDLGMKGKRAIVTGASRGIGRAIALELAAEGCDVALVARDSGLLDDVAGLVAAYGVRAVPFSTDLSTAEGCQLAFDIAAGALGGVDILVNNAGAATMQPVLGLTVEAIDEALRLKTYGYLRLAQLCIPGMRERQWGRIVNIAGGAGTSPAAGNLPTSLANIGVLNITRALSDAVSGDGILVNTICPGMTNTDRARTLARGRAEREGLEIEAVVSAMGAAVPAGRIAEPEEIARVAVFLASEACSYVHGSSVYMDGGGRRGIP